MVGLVGHTSGSSMTFEPCRNPGSHHHTTPGMSLSAPAAAAGAESIVGAWSPDRLPASATCSSVAEPAGLIQTLGSHRH